MESITGEIVILPHRDIDDFLAKVPNCWAVVSIREPHYTEAELADAKQTLKLVFEDVGSSGRQFGQGPQPAHVQRILKFTKQTGNTAIVFQCWAGQSRSTSAALVVDCE